MPRMTKSQTIGSTQRRTQHADALLKKRFAVLAFFDKCFCAIAFSVLLVSPTNAANNNINTAVVDPDNINIYAAHLTDELTSKCDSSSFSNCQLNALDQASLVDILIHSDIDGEISHAIENTEYELLIGSAIINERATSEADVETQLVLEISTQWRGISLDDSQLAITLNRTQGALSASDGAKLLMTQWVEGAVTRSLFSAPFLYQFLGASDYQNDLQVPDKIGDFALSRQHLFNDPMKGMLSRYIHQEFDLAVFDVYVYPLKTSAPAELQSQSELLAEQEDIRLISEALGDDALTMSDIYELDPIEGISDTRVFGFQASLKTNSDPLFATQYLYVKNDKVVKFSINVPARITDALIANAIANIVVPGESVLMKQVRHNDNTVASTRAVAP